MTEPQAVGPVAGAIERSRIARARGLAKALVDLPDSGSSVEGIREVAAEIVQLLDLPPTEGAVGLLREARELLPHGAYAGYRHDERGGLIERIDAALGGSRDVTVTKRWWIVVDPEDGTPYAVENAEDDAHATAATFGDAEVVEVVRADDTPGGR